MFVKVLWVALREPKMIVTRLCRSPEKRIRADPGFLKCDAVRVSQRGGGRLLRKTNPTHYRRYPLLINDEQYVPAGWGEVKDFTAFMKYRVTAFFAQECA